MKDERVKKSFVPWVFNIVYWIFLFCCVVTMILIVQFRLQGGQGISIGKYSSYIVLTGSMSPTFDAGSFILTKQTVPSQIKQGDIITYYIEGQGKAVLTHRVVEVWIENNKYFFTTRGDSNNMNDSKPVEESQLIGKTFFWIAGLGFLILWARSGPGMLIIIAVILFIWILESAIKKIKITKDREGHQDGRQ